MTVRHVCPVCSLSFIGRANRRFCSMVCRNKAPGRMASPETRARLRAAKSGDNAPMRKPGVAAKVAATRRLNGSYDGRLRKNFKGEWLSVERGRDTPRWYVWLTPEERALYGRKTSAIKRAVLI